MTIASMYAEFAVREARGVSPTFERLSLAISVDEKILALLETVPAPKRQPNLLLSVVRSSVAHWMIRPPSVTSPWRTGKT